MTTRDYPKFLAYYVFYYISMVVLFLFLPVFFTRQGFGKTAVGTIMAIGPFVGLVAQPVWGTVADRSRDKTRVLSILLLCAGLASLAFYISTSFIPVIGIMVVFAFFQISIEPIGSAATLEYLYVVKRKFGPVRMAGTISFTVAAVGAGFLMDLEIRLVFLLYCAIGIIASGVAWSMPRIPGHQSTGKRVSMVTLLKNRELVLLTVCSGIISTTLFFYYVFFPIHYTNLGASPVMLGWSAAISAAPEVLILLFADKIYRKIGARGMIMGAGIVLTIRWILYSIVTDPIVILPLQLLHGFTFVVLSFALTFYISETVQPELKASGQAFHILVVGVICRIVGQMLGGYLSDLWSIQRMFLINGILVALTLIVFAAVFALVPKDRLRSS